MSITGSCGQELFHVASNHSRIFLPEALVVHTEQYDKQKREDDSHEVQEARKWGLSVEEYRKQKEGLNPNQSIRQQFPEERVQREKEELKKLRQEHVFKRQGSSEQEQYQRYLDPKRQDYKNR